MPKEDVDVEEERRTGCWAKMASKDGGEAGSAIFCGLEGQLIELNEPVKMSARRIPRGGCAR